jgi:dienelactone hydrolase
MKAPAGALAPRLIALALVVTISCATTDSVTPGGATSPGPPVPVAQEVTLLTSADGQQSVRTPPPGPHAVGFRTVELSDPSRSGGAPFDWEGAPPAIHAGRPIAVSLWYPAIPGGSTSEGGVSRMGLRDYIGYFTTAGEYPGGPTQREETARRYLEGCAPLAPHAYREMETAAHAVWNAPAAAGRFPLVVYAPGFGSSAVENFYLHEWLASRGYVVVGVDSWGAHGRMTPDAEGLEVQAQDMEFALRWARGQANIDAERVALVGFSWGGMANVLAAMRNPDVDAVVSLDGSVHYWQELLSGLPTYCPDRLTVPALFLGCRELAAETREVHGVDFFDRLRYADATMVVFPGLGHLNFTSFSPLLDEANPYYATDPLVVGPSLEWIARYTAAFLDWVLRDEAEGRDFLARSPAENGIPDGAALVERRSARRPMPGLSASTADVGPHVVPPGVKAARVLDVAGTADEGYSLGERELTGGHTPLQASMWPQRPWWCSR